jgi:hypothetical protein
VNIVRFFLMRGARFRADTIPFIRKSGSRTPGGGIRFRGVIPNFEAPRPNTAIAVPDPIRAAVESALIILVEGYNLLATQIRERYRIKRFCIKD